MDHNGIYIIAIILICTQNYNFFNIRNGSFKNGNMEGIGIFTYKNGEQRELLMKNNLCICDKTGKFTI